MGIEPITHCLQGNVAPLEHAPPHWCLLQELNLYPAAYETTALPIKLNRQFGTRGGS